MGARAAIPIERVAVAAYAIPTDRPETDAALQRAAIGDAALFVDANGACRRKQALAEARSLPFSAHTAPSLHVHSCFALPPVAGTLRPDLSRPGLGLELKRADAARYAA